MLTYEEFLKQLHGALNHLYEPDRLRQSPLAPLFDVARRSDTFSALQRILTEAIESLEPKGDEPPQSQAWEIYEPLFYRYVQQLGQSHVAKQLGMSVRHLRRKEHAALEVLAGLLWEQFDLDVKLQQGKARTTVDGPTVNEELAWLKDTPPESPADLNQILPDILKLAAPLTARHKVRLKDSIASELPSLAVHPVALNQALLCLLTVVIHHASDSEVAITARPLPSGVVVEIQAPQPSPRPLPMPDDDVASLELAQRLADLCGGKLTLSDTEGLFSATLTIPALQQLPVLVIDDNADTLQLLRRYTAGTRYHLITTQEPEQASSLAERFSPRIIVLDVMMPQVDGWKMLTRLQQSPHTKRIPIVVCTILAQKEMALALGASGFMRKPITRQAFLAALDQQVELMATESD
jgi:CheY-like chemotaxis protein